MTLTEPMDQGPDPVVASLNLKAIALPAEHGAYAMLAEPVLLGLVLAPSAPGLAVAWAATFGFLARHPLKLRLTDARRERRTARRAAAERWAAFYAGLALLGLALALGSASRWWLPLTAAAPLAAVQLLYDVRQRGKELVPEILGAVALGSVAGAVCLAGGWPLVPALAVWALLAAKTVSTVLYVRARLRMDRGREAAGLGVFASHAAAVFVAAMLAANHLAPWLSVPVFVLLLLRSAFGLSRFRRPVRPQVIGLREAAYGLAFVAAMAFAYRAGL